MKVTENEQLYDQLQSELLQRIALRVRQYLCSVEQGRVPWNADAITADIVLKIASIIDGCDEDDSVVPVLTFARTEARDELIVPKVGRGSRMHAYAHGGSDTSEEP